MSHHQPDPNKNVTLTIDGISVTVPEGTRILEAAKKANISIPTLCEHPDLCKRALCRICVVEADGRGKLIAACANDVWEGVKIVTNNQRLLNIRKTIVELILADHPQDCLSCVRSTNCELQTLAKTFSVNGSLFANDAEKKPLKIESETIVRDMGKCVKCNRCVEVCQEVQTIRALNTSHRSHEYEISTPYKQGLKESGCVFCGKCAEVCPVGAIYGYEVGSREWGVGSGERRAIAQVSLEFVDAVNKELGFADSGAGACCGGYAKNINDCCGGVKPKAAVVTAGKIVSALKMLGFDKVYDMAAAANVVDAEICDEVQARRSGGKLPVISGCSEGVVNFVNYFYPDLADHLTAVKNPRRLFADSNNNVVTVSFVCCLAQKYRVEPQPSQKGEGSPLDSSDKTDFALTAKELARMIKMAGIVIETLSEEPFDTISFDTLKSDNCLQAGLVKKETIYGYAEARKVMEAIRNGECKAEWVEIIN